MSFFKVTCPWCGQSYTTGVVGTTPVGSGHKCKVIKSCEQEDCEEKGTFLDEDGSFYCSDHIWPGHVIVMVQP